MAAGKGKAGPARLVVAALSLSAAGLVGIVAHEGYTDSAVVPTKGDRPTVGFGSTFHEDGKPVRVGDRTDPVRALVKAKSHIDREERAFRETLPGVRLTQGEYDLYLDFTYQYGLTNWRTSSMRKRLRAGEYHAACDALLQWRKAAGYDCSTLVGGKPNRRCWGVWERQLERHAKCIVEQGG
jgi:lysozyme